jgi:hypothetical protein
MGSARVRHAVRSQMGKNQANVKCCKGTWSGPHEQSPGAEQQQRTAAELAILPSSTLPPPPPLFSPNSLIS